MSANATPTCASFYKRRDNKIDLAIYVKRFPKFQQQDSEDEILGKVAKIAYIRLGKVVKTVVKIIA